MGREAFPVRTFLVLAVLNLLGSLAVAPYSHSLLEQVSRQGRGPVLSMPFWVLLIAQLFMAVVFNTPLLVAGLLLARRLGLGAPLLDAWSRGEPVRERWRSIAPRALLVGAVGGAVVLILLQIVFEPSVTAELTRQGVTLPDVEHPPAGESLLASYGAAVTEEILLRLFLLTFLAWLGSLVAGKRDGRPRTGVLWTANVLAALIFGAMHLPQAKMLIEGASLGPWMIAQVLVGNGLVGLAFGWLYWRDGLESAMLAHFWTDIVLHVLGPLLPWGT